MLHNNYHLWYCITLQIGNTVKVNPPPLMNISLGQTRYCYTVKIFESIILTSPKIVDIHHIFCHILQHTILSFFYLLIELYIQLGVEKFNGIDKHKCIVQQLGLNRPDQLESIFQLIVFFFSQPVRMRSGLLCITFCMSVCMRRNKNHISGTAFHQVPKFGQSMDMDDLVVNPGGQDHRSRSQVKDLGHQLKKM